MPCPLFLRSELGAVLEEIKILGFGGPGLKIRVLKEHSFPAPVLGGEGRVEGAVLVAVLVRDIDY